MHSVARQLVIRGTVQGVGFRWYTRDRARELGVAGWVRNLPDGGVEAFVEGAPDRVDEMVAWLRHGPSSARVRSVDVIEAAPAGGDSFDVRR